MKEKNTFLAIDLKSFYASVECRERGLDPLTTNLVVADVSRTEKTICLAVSPSLKAYGIPGRARLFEVVSKMKEVNASRRFRAPRWTFTGKSWDSDILANNPSLEVDYIAATPRMALYMDYSTRIYQVYLKYIAPEDIHVYSIDEVMIDATEYLGTYGLTGRELAQKLIREVYRETGITATAGVGTNLYLAKVAMDILAKHEEPDEQGVRIAELDERSYRERLWSHRPLRDFWRVGAGYVKKLEAHGMFTMGDIARCSLGGPNDFLNEDLLFDMFGINAELLIDHAWGWEPCTMAAIKAYQPEDRSFSSGQVLPCPYEAAKARTIVHEMADAVALSLVDRQLVADQLVLTVNYDRSSLTDPVIRARYRGEITKDYYGRPAPKHAHGTAALGTYTSSGRRICQAVLDLYDRIVNPDLLVRRITLGVSHVIPENKAPRRTDSFEQLDLFTDYAAREEEQKRNEEELAKEKNLQKAMLDIRKKFGANSIVKGINMKEESTGMDRNKYIGGHKA